MVGYKLTAACGRKTVVVGDIELVEVLRKDYERLEGKNVQKEETL